MKIKVKCPYTIKIAIIFNKIINIQNKILLITVVSYKLIPIAVLQQYIRKQTYTQTNHVTTRRTVCNHLSSIHSLDRVVRNTLGVGKANPKKKCAARNPIFLGGSESRVKQMKRKGRPNSVYKH